MQELFLSFIIIFTLIALMSVGYFVANKTIKGTCGGIGALFGQCDLCDHKDKCESKDQSP